MSTLNPTLAGAVSKAERGIAFLKIPGATSDHLRSAMDHFKSATKLAASHFTVLVELEDQVPEPGPALFDETGAPAAGIQVGSAGIGLRIEEHPVLTMGYEAYSNAGWKECEALDEELLFAMRLHVRARGMDYTALRDLVMDDLGGIDEATFPWLVEQITTSGAFEWPHHCEDCQCIETPAADGTVLCWRCKDKRAKAATAKAKKETKKAANAASKNPPTNPLSRPHGSGEGGDE